MGGVPLLIKRDTMTNGNMIYVAKSDYRVVVFTSPLLRDNLVNRGDAITMLVSFKPAAEPTLTTLEDKKLLLTCAYCGKVNRGVPIEITKRLIGYEVLDPGVFFIASPDKAKELIESGHAKAYSVNFKSGVLGLTAG